MIKRLHFAITLFASFLIFLTAFPKMISIFLALVTAGLSTVPDYDLRIYSWANRKKMIIENKKLLKYLLFPYYIFLIFLLKIFKHRTTTHNIFFSLSFFFLVFLTGIPILRLFFFILFLSTVLHIIEDAFTVSGVPLFFPISKVRFKIPVINTNKDLRLQKTLSVFFIFLTILFYMLL